MRSAVGAGKRLCAAIEHARPSGVCRSFEQLNSLEISFVRRQAAVIKWSVFRRVAFLLNQAGTFWLYPALVLGLAFAWRSKATSVLEAAALAVLVCHAIYPLIKAFAGRVRPCDGYPGFDPWSTPLDKYSFPSGHSMTASAAFVPIGFTFPQLIILAVVVWLLLAWARIAVAHHYPTDLLGGAALGVLVSLPISYIMLD